MPDRSGMLFRHLEVEQLDGVCAVTLNRPERLNALGIGAGSNRQELVDAMQGADEDDGIGCILLRANGRAFCAGGDLADAPKSETAYDEHVFNVELAHCYYALRAVRKPVVAAVHGLCLGAGVGLIAQCDIVVAAEDARFGLVEGRIGHPGACEIVPIVGAAWAKFLILTGEIIDAITAREIGLVLTVLRHEEFQQRTLDLARRIARTPRESAVLNKASINATADAMGRHAGRLAGRAHETVTKAMARDARAPDGRRFADILANEGMDGLKRARDTQFTGPWLPSRTGQGVD